MPNRLRLALLPALVLALLAPAAASARPAAITGTLSKPGYTVVALGYDGSAVSSHARSFKLVPRSARVTLQLRDARGKYAGPVVVGTSHGKAVLGVKAGAKLGRIDVLAGFAKARKPVAAKFVDAKRTIARGATPAGNGRNFGLVRSKGHGPAGRGGDTDRDGVPNAFDIDADGDLVLNPLERATAATPRAFAAQVQPPKPGGPAQPQRQSFNNFSQLFLEIDRTVNADAAAVTQADIDAAVAANLEVVFLQVPANTELDCGGLSWCSAGGTGIANRDPRTVGAGLPFPSCCDADGDGLGAMPLNERGEFRLLPSAPASKIGSGDTMIEHTPDGTELPGSLAFVFNTVPAVNRWADGAGNGATITYPAPPGTPGTRTSPIEIAASPTGDYELTFTFWRPQRSAIASAGEGDGFVDIGGLAYAVNVPSFGPAPAGGSQSPQCAAGSVTTSDPSLTVTTLPSSPGVSAVDSALDRPASAANLLTLSVNLSRCAQLRGQTLLPGVNLNLDLAANPTDPQSHDHANQMIYVRTR